jgi:molecular chaperone DnaK
MGRVVGIDLGTTYSCVATVEGGQPKVIPYKGNQFTVPSMVAIDEKGNKLIGHEAKRQWQLNPKNTIYGAKRFIGRAFSEGTVKKIKEHFAYDIVAGENGDCRIKIGDRPYGLDEISAMILDKMRDIAQEYFQEKVEKAVVTVPAYFNDRQRQAVRDAGDMIGLDVVRIINEPTAAAIAYGLGKHLSSKILIFDLGGGTFDVSVVEIRDRVFEVKSTGGDTFLGGVDWDDRLISYVLDDFKQKTGLDLTNDQVAKMRVKDACEDAKLKLSASTQVPINIPFIARSPAGPLNIDIVMTRAKFEELTKDLVGRTIEIASRVLEESGLGIAEIDTLLLVGGMTRVPMVQTAVTALLGGRAPSKGVHPDEAVAIGAALLAETLTSHDAESIVLLDVLPQSIGIAAADGQFVPIFRKNTSIPNYKSRQLTTSRDNQTTLNLKIYQGEEALADQNELLGNFLFSGIRAKAAGQIRVDAVFNISPEGILHVSANDPETGTEMETTLQVQSGITKRQRSKTLSS